MGFIARTCRDIELYNGINDDRNKYTIVIGKNGCGKSRLLKDICTAYEQQFLSSLVKQMQSIPYLLNITGTKSEDIIDFIVERDKILLPANIIATSTSPFDQFQTKGHTFKGFEHVNYYNYIGVKSILKTENPSVAIASEAMLLLFDKMSAKDKKSFSALSSCLKLFGFPTVLELELDFNFELTDYRKKTQKLNSYKANKNKIEELKRLRDNCSIDDIEEMLEHYNSLAKYRNKLIIKLTKNGIVDLEGGSNFLLPLKVLLKKGFAEISDVKSVHFDERNKQQNYVNKGDFRVIRLKNMSSGEQCIFLLLLGIAAKLRDNSLVCIDEPELSLHPAWQMSFMNAIINSFSVFNGCHFIISTHSPQIISNISTKNCSVLDLESKNIENINNFKHRSSDFQLATLFKTPGYKNEYLLNEAVSILSSFSKGDISDELKEKTSNFLKLKNFTLTDDPVNELFQIIELAMEESF